MFDGLWKKIGELGEGSKKKFNSLWNKLDRGDKKSLALLKRKPITARVISGQSL
ncbi:MAG: hypothetical protein AAB488_00240 [Patescibacteria group bacterium]